MSLSTTKEQPVTEKMGVSKRLARVWEDFKGAFANVPKSFRLLWKAHPGATIGMVVVTALTAFTPLVQAWLSKLIIDTIVENLNGKLPVEEGIRRVLPYVLIEFVVFTLSIANNQVRSLLEHIANARLGHSVSNAIIRKAIDLDLAYFEDAEFYDKMQRAQDEVSYRPLIVVNNSFLLIQNLVTMISLLALLLAFGPLIALLLFGGVIPSFIAQLKYSKLHFSLLTWYSPEARRQAYWQYLMTNNAAVKEIKLFGLGAPLLSRYNELFWTYYKKDAALGIRSTVFGLIWGLAATTSYYAAFGWVIYRTLSGEITLGDLTLYLTVLRQSQGSFQGLFYSIGQIYEGSLYMTNLFNFLNLQPKVKPPAQTLPVPRPFKQGIEFRDVSFQYPGRTDLALEHLNLKIGPEEKLALVGSNGAGKTTLVKLLTRLYEPTGGKILLDGVELKDYDLAELRQCIGVIFQDFVRYETTARENIGYGQVEDLEDSERVEEAARRGGGDTVVAELPQGYDTTLGRMFDQGHELSGGQWQKIALSRAFMRKSEVVILDEPTSALDAEREYEIFQRFRELTRGKMALLISHRFSTVRMADRIAVLEGGKIIELGSHQELLKLDGTYARLFNLQAEGYR
jgi:ATP-binding cassette subfamily B protein